MKSSLVVRMIGFLDLFMKWLIADQKPTSSLNTTSISSNNMSDSLCRLTFFSVLGDDDDDDSDRVDADEELLTFSSLESLSFEWVESCELSSWSSVLSVLLRFDDLCRDRTVSRRKLILRFFLGFVSIDRFFFGFDFGSFRFSSLRRFFDVVAFDFSSPVKFVAADDLKNLSSLKFRSFSLRLVAESPVVELFETWCELSAPSSSCMMWLLHRKLDELTSNTYYLEKKSIQVF